MQLGFVLDHSRCIGCHACTVACKAENDVPVGSFRTWVKYTERGTFPAVKRSFAVLRCNQCSAAPCMTICPTGALFKRSDGIVDLDRDVCIGCKSCMQGCPYDALYVHPDHGTAEKCHFCAHRTELGLAPACAVVCPTEAIVPGDFDDPLSRVSQLVAQGDLTVRKPEAGTRPNVHYRDVSPDGVEPLATSRAGGYLWSRRPAGPQVEAELARSLEERAREGRTTYDVEHALPWGSRVSTYLLTKSVSAGLLLAPAGELAELARGGPGARGALAWLAAGSLLFLAITCVLLVVDLKRPERFWMILTRGNFSSWLVKGTYVLMAHGALAGVWLALGLGWFELPDALDLPLRAATLVAAALAACYTAFLFAQAKGRVLWLQRGLWAQLIAQALVAGAGALLLAGPAIGLPAEHAPELAFTLAGGMALHLVLTLAGGVLGPLGREAEYREAHALLHRGPWARQHKLGIVLGACAFALGVAAGALAGGAGAWLGALAALLGLVALALSEDAYVKTGQALPLS